MIKNIMLDLDISVLFIAASVWLLMAVLNRIYYKPVGNIISHREDKIKKDSDRLQSLLDEVERQTQEIERILVDARKESMVLQEELIRKGEDVRNKLIAASKSQSRELFQNKVSSLNDEILKAEKKIMNDIDLFTQKMKEIFL
jgi:F0F1-type ATP synthase membrane subunit b/b'